MYSNLHIPLVAAGLMAGSSVLAGIPARWSLLVASSAGAYLIYQVDRVWLYRQEDYINQPDRVAWNARHPFYLKTSFLAAVAALVLASLSLPWSTLAMGGLLGAGGLAYLIGYGRKGFRLKRLWAVKPLVIAGAWTIGTVCLPVFAAGSAIGSQIAIVAVYRFAFILSNVFLADWPDREGDAAAELKSLAVIKGAPGVRIWTTIAAGMSLLIGIAQAIAFAWPAPVWVDLGGPLLMILAAQKSFTRSHWFYGFVNDLIVAWPLTTAALTAIWGARV